MPENPEQEKGCQIRPVGGPAQVLREHRDTLVSVMETFVHDPLVEWTKRERGAEDADNPQAKDALATLEGGCAGWGAARGRVVYQDAQRAVVHESQGGFWGIPSMVLH